MYHGLRSAPGVAAAASGLLLALAFPPSPLFFLAFVGLLPLWQLLSRDRRGFRWGFLAGVVYHGGTIWWIALNSDLPRLAALASMLGAVLWLCLLWGLAGWGAARLAARLGPAAVLSHAPLLILVDWLSIGTEMGFPWNLVGVTQAQNPLLSPIAAVGGMHAMTALVLAGNALLWLALRARGRRRGLALGGFALLWVLPGMLYGPATSGLRWLEREPLQVLLVQGNVDPRLKWSNHWSWCLGIHERLSREALREAPADLVIWPETAAPSRLAENGPMKRRLRAFCRDTRSLLLTGGNDTKIVEEKRRPLNGSYLIDSSGIIERYHKIRLVPFGERVPGQRLLPFLGELNMGQAEFLPGEVRGPGTLPGEDSLRYGRSICFEGNFAELSREAVLGGASFLSNQTNDAWFGRSLQLDQHLAVGALRAIETGRWLVRACNNGYSALIDPRGRAVQLLPKGEEGVIRAAVPLVSGTTWYTRLGEWVPLLALVLLLAPVGTALRPGRRS